LVTQSGFFIFKDVFIKEKPNLVGQSISELVGGSVLERMAECELAGRLDCLAMVERYSREANRC